MDTIVMVSSQIPTRSQLFGLRTGMDGMVPPFDFVIFLTKNNEINFFSAMHVGQEI